MSLFIKKKTPSSWEGPMSLLKCILLEHLYSVALVAHPDLCIPWPSHYGSIQNEKFCTTNSYHMNFYILGNSQFNITVINVCVGFRALHISSLLEIHSTSRLPKRFWNVCLVYFLFFVKMVYSLSKQHDSSGTWAGILVPKRLVSMRPSALLTQTMCSVTIEPFLKKIGPQRQDGHTF